MNRWKTFLIAAVLGPFAGDVVAGQIDLFLSSTVVPSPPHQAGQSVTVTLTLSNAGPDTAGASAPPNTPLPTVRASTTVRVNADNRLPVNFTPVVPTVCNFEPIPLDPIPGERAGIIFVVYFPNLPPGASQSCSLVATIDATTTSDFVTRWTASSLADVDGNPSNNGTDVAFGLSPRAVDGLSLPGLVVLSCGVLLIVLTRRMVT